MTNTISTCFINFVPVRFNQNWMVNSTHFTKLRILNNKKMGDSNLLNICIKVIEFVYRIRIREENSDVSTSKPDKWYIKDFSWQQKHLSQTEREVFKETSDLEEVNNGNIVISSTSDDKNYFLFTYVQNAEFISEEEVNIHAS